MIIKTMDGRRIVNLSSYYIEKGMYYASLVGNGSDVIAAYEKVEDAEKAIEALDYLIGVGDVRMFDANNLLDQYEAMQQDKF